MIPASLRRRTAVTIHLSAQLQASARRLEDVCAILRERGHDDRALEDAEAYARTLGRWCRGEAHPATLAVAARVVSSWGHYPFLRGATASEDMVLEAWLLAVDRDHACAYPTHYYRPMHLRGVGTSTGAPILRALVSATGDPEDACVARLLALWDAAYARVGP